MIQKQWFGTGTRYGLEILQQWGKRITTKSQKVLGANSYVCRSSRGKTAFLSPILNRVKVLFKLMNKVVLQRVLQVIQLSLIFTYLNSKHYMNLSEQFNILWKHLVVILRFGSITVHFSEMGKFDLRF